MAIVRRLKGVLIKPIETFRTAKEDKIGEVLAYFLFIFSIVLIIWGLLIIARLTFFTDFYGINYETIATLGITQISYVIICMFIGGLIGLGIASVLIHILVGFLTDGNGFGETVKAVAYSATPLVLLGWIPIFIHGGIPIFTLIAIVWSLILCIIGIRVLHDTTTLRAAGAVILPIFITIFIIIFIVLKIVVKILKWTLKLTFESM